MRQVACRYAVVQFMPFSETGEFANVGVALMCPQTGYFDFKLQTRKHRRVTDFFDQLPRTVYLRAVQGIASELGRVAQVVEATRMDVRPDVLRQVFDALVHPREAIVRFSTTRVVLTDDPAQELVRKFDHYVDRSFATPEYVEHEMERRIRVLLGSLNLAHPFKSAQVGDEEVHVRFPLVQRRGDAVDKVIKPFNLTQAEPMAIYDHGGTWLQRVQRLRKRKLLPAQVLFAMRGPTDDDVKRHAAYREICAELGEQGVVVIDETAHDQIADFARA